MYEMLDYLKLTWKHEWHRNLPLQDCNFRCPKRKSIISHQARGRKKIPQDRGITVVFLLLLDGGQKRLIWHGICSNFTGNALKPTLIHS